MISGPPGGSSKSESANEPPGADSSAASDRSSDRLSNLPAGTAAGFPGAEPDAAASGAFGTTTRVWHFGQGTVPPAQRVGTWSFARQPVQRNANGMLVTASDEARATGWSAEAISSLRAKASECTVAVASAATLPSIMPGTFGAVEQGHC